MKLPSRKKTHSITNIDFDSRSGRVHHSVVTHTPANDLEQHEAVVDLSDEARKSIEILEIEPYVKRGTIASIAPPIAKGAVPIATLGLLVAYISHLTHHDPIVWVVFGMVSVFIMFIALIVASQRWLSLDRHRGRLGRISREHGAELIPGYAPEVTTATFTIGGDPCARDMVNQVVDGGDEQHLIDHDAVYRVLGEMVTVANADMSDTQREETQSVYRDTLDDLAHQWRSTCDQHNEIVESTRDVNRQFTADMLKSDAQRTRDSLLGVRTELGD